ncbi:hypothetical protein C8T65DRAFT_64982 [Cerioporus squamosus]|nr:hypothetical protein C8T65DRAFT_64982 [Cerioporus squamosus]
MQSRRWAGEKTVRRSQFRTRLPMRARYVSRRYAQTELEIARAHLMSVQRYVASGRCRSCGSGSVSATKTRRPACIPRPCSASSIVEAGREGEAWTWRASSWKNEHQRRATMPGYGPRTYLLCRCLATQRTSYLPDGSSQCPGWLEARDSGAHLPLPLHRTSISELQRVAAEPEPGAGSREMRGGGRADGDMTPHPRLSQPKYVGSRAPGPCARVRCLVTVSASEEVRVYASAVLQGILGQRWWRTVSTYYVLLHVRSRSVSYLVGS